jgi:hypothetical protein
LYFTFITGLTIGYGDMVPRQALARALAIGIGVCGLFLTGVIALTPAIFASSSDGIPTPLRPADALVVLLVELCVANDG